MTAAWSAFYDDVLPHVPGCATPLADYHLKRSAINFMRKTRAWRLSGLAADAGGTALRAFAALPTSLVPVGARVLTIESCKYDGTRLLPRTPEQLDEQYSDWTAVTGSPLYLVRPRDVQMTGFFMVPAPLAASTALLRLELSLCPTETAVGVDDNIFAEYRVAIADGAKATLLAMRRSPWADVEMAAAYGQATAAAISAAQLRADRGADRQKLVTKPCAF